MSDVPDAGLRRCAACGSDVPAGRHCVRCGAAHEGVVRRGYAASPNERELVPFVVSSLFPRLPRTAMRAFRLVLAVGVVAVVALGAAGLYPVAVAAAAVVVPLLAVVYLYDVDVYEDEPYRVLAFTVAWGSAAGAATGFVGRTVAPSGVDLLAASTAERLLVSGLALPALGLALALAGPLVLLPYRKFNDALDGATFGAASAAWLVGAQLLTQSSPLFEQGLRPAGDVLPWLLRLVELAVAAPLLWAGAVGAVAGAAWLRYRAPVRDRRALGLAGRPLVSLAAAALGLVAGAVVQILLPLGGSLPLLLALAAGALVWLRRVIHVGLVQEALELEIGPEVACANCGARTPFHTFCAGCGISLRALPKARAEEEALPRGAAPARLRGSRVSGLSLGSILALAVVAAVVTRALAPPPTQPECLPGEICGGPPASSPPLVTGTRWTSAELGYRLEYDGGYWQLVGEDGRGLQLKLDGRAEDILLSIAGRSSADVQAAYDDELEQLRSRFVDLEERPDLPVFGPNVGYRDGIGGWFSGTINTPQGPGERAFVVLLAAGAGQTSLVASAAFTDVDRSVPALGALVDTVLNTVVWPAGDTGSGPETAIALAGPPQPAPTEARLAGPTDPDLPLELGVALALPGEAALERYLREVHDPASPSFRRYLTAGELGARFGLPDAEIARIRSSLEAGGLEVTGSYPQRTALRVRGRVREVERYFGVSLSDFVTPAGERYHAPDSEPVLPAGLRGFVVAVEGLSTEPAPRPALAVPAQGLRPIDAARAYDVEPLWEQGIRGAGQVVAVVSYDSFRDEDIAEYDRLAGVDGAPPVERVRIQGGAPLGRQAIEASLDVEVVRAIAPEAQIVSYEAPNTLSAAVEVIRRIVADGRADIVSVSWGLCHPFWPDDLREAEEREYALAAAQGINVFVASGDSGAYGCLHRADPLAADNQQEAVGWPASSPSVIAVGGTRLSVRRDGRYLSEEGWEDAVSRTGTGGGVSPVYPRPAWQRGPGVESGFSTGNRQVPDVAGPADCDSAFFIVYPVVDARGAVRRVETGPQGCGTSAAAPFWAGVAALLAQYAQREGAGELGFLNPVLYELAAAAQPFPPFHDVTRGGNLKHAAAPGWDYATGLGSPDVFNLARDLVARLLSSP